MMWSFLTVLSYAASVATSQTVPSCSEGATNCTLVCDSSTNCGSTDNGLGRGETLSCPTDANCELCELQCSGDRECQSVTLNGNSCSEVSVVIGTGDNVAKYMTINAPNNDGNLLVDLSQITSSDKNVFQHSLITAQTDTNEIILNCNGNGDGNECDDIEIQATTANYLEVNCLQSVSCQDMKVTCPADSSLPYPACDINCFSSGGTFCNGFSITIDSQTWFDDLNVTAESGSFSVTCDDGAGGTETCSLDTATNRCTNGNDLACSVTLPPTSRPTFVPTFVPTEFTSIPSHEPSNFPTEDPTKYPSIGPTTDPTVGPSNEPTRRPSELPSAEPSVEPTVEPTFVPTKVPSDVPTGVPTDAPTNVPTSHTSEPSQTPASAPTVAPSVAPIVAPVPSEAVEEFEEFEPTATPTTPEDELTSKKGADDDELDTGAILGMVAACWIALMCLGGGAYVWARQKKKEKTHQMSKASGNKTDPKLAPAHSLQSMSRGGVSLSQSNSVANGTNQTPRPADDTNTQINTNMNASHAYENSSVGSSKSSGLTPNLSPQTSPQMAPQTPESLPRAQKREDTMSSRVRVIVDPEELSPGLKALAKPVWVTDDEDDRNSGGMDLLDDEFLDDEDDLEPHDDEEKASEYVTPGGPGDMNIDEKEIDNININGDENDDDDDDDMSMSSEEQLEQIRNHVLQQSLSKKMMMKGIEQMEQLEQREAMNVLGTMNAMDNNNNVEMQQVDPKKSDIV